jgi:hypothetical protein
LKKLKPLTKKQKKEEIENLTLLAASYREEAKRQGRKKRVMIPFELEIGNFCCSKLNKAFKDNEFYIKIEQIGSKYYAWVSQYNSEYHKNHCPYCHKLIEDFFYIKEY